MDAAVNERLTPQPPPAPNSNRPIWELVIEDMKARDEQGRAKYGVPLQADNGRDPLMDAYQESLDLCAYLRQDEFAALLQKTSLISMINASKIVTDRLDFLKGLEYLLYDPQMRPTVKERAQLHKLVSRNTWMFGDEFFLVNNDESLENVLRRHVKDVLFDVDLDEPVVRPDGKKGVVDIGLSNIPPDEQIVESDVVISKVLERQPAEGRHHLIIELKRPSEPVSSKVISQAKSYAFAVAADARFQNVRTNWTFWALSTKMDEYAQLEAQLDGQPQGVVYQSKANAGRNYNMTVWAKAWSEVIEQCYARLRFFQERLNYNANQSSGKQFLRDTYPKFIPNFVKAENATTDEDHDETQPPPKKASAPPAPNSNRPIWELVIEDMKARDEQGRAKYGVPLQADNGRDPLMDAYQESLDLCAYLRQAIEERGQQ